MDRTYRKTGDKVVFWSVAQKLLGQLVVVYMPETDSWKGGYLIGLIPADDLFVIRWSKRSSANTMPGIWRLHDRVLFTGTRLLPIPKYPARLPQSTNQHSQGGSMATTKKASGKTPAKKGTTKKATTKATNGDSAAPKKATGGRTRGPDKLEGLTDARKRNIAKLIYRERSKSPATSWPDITTKIEEKYDWTLPGSMTGRRLLREFGPDNAEEAIIQQNREKKAASKAAAKTTKKRAKKVVEEPDEDEVEDEELEDEDELEAEDDEELEADEDDEDEDEDEDEDDEEEPPAKAKKVRVTKGRGKKANPSK